MNLSKKSRYGITALIDLALNSKEGHVSLISIAERHGISPQYLEHIFAALRRAGIIKSIKGAQGGYLLGDSSSNISVADIIEALDGTYRIEKEDTTDGNNVGISLAIQDSIIDKINDRLDEILQNTSLADLENHYKDYIENTQNMYYI